MNLKTLTTLLLIALFSLQIEAKAQENPSEIDKTESLIDKSLHKFKISAYFQGQYQIGQKDVKRLGVGAENEHFGKESFNRYGLRRAFVSSLYEDGIVYGLLTFEAKDRGLGISDAYLCITEPWTNSISLTAGSFPRPFGYELSISPSIYELVEGTNFIYTLFPDVHDVGAMLTFKAPEKWASLKFDAALVAGNGVNQETDSKRDFIGHLIASTDKNNIVVLKGGISYYRGFVYQGTNNVYVMSGDKFVSNGKADNLGAYAKREYYGADAQLGIKTPFGHAEFRGEYIFGEQPGAQSSTESPNSGKRPEHDTYIRNFRAGYIHYLQQIGKMPLTFMGAYNWYDPNTKVSGNEIGKSNTNEADLKYQTISLGLIWFPYKSIRVQTFYEIPFNEKSANLSGYNEDKKDNIFTLRLQYKF